MLEHHQSLLEMFGNGTISKESWMPDQVLGKDFPKMAFRE